MTAFSSGIIVSTLQARCLFGHQNTPRATEREREREHARDDPSRIKHTETKALDATDLNHRNETL